MNSAALLIPIKDFSAAKSRLAERLTLGERSELARRMAAIVMDAASPLDPFVVCDDQAVAAWAESRGAAVIWRPANGLNAAVAEGVRFLADHVDRVVVAHADLPLAHELAWVADFEGVTIVPDRHDDGTNVMSVPATSDFEFGYGTDSFARHGAEARRLGLPLRIVRDRRLGWDVDRPDDLDHDGLAAVMSNLMTASSSPQPSSPQASPQASPQGERSLGCDGE